MNTLKLFYEYFIDIFTKINHLKNTQMKIHVSLLSFLVFLILSNHLFSQNTELKKSPINGTWIELEKKSDTIVFLPEYNGQYPIFELKRGFRIADGNKLPDYFSGPYHFKLGINSISLFWFLSSASFQNFYFKMIPEEDKFEIGNFFKDPEKKKQEADTLSFIRIK